MGLELSASQAQIYYSNSDNGAAKMQSIERNQTANSKFNKLTVYEYVCLPVDELVIKRHKSKESLQALSMDDLETYLHFNTESLGESLEEKDERK